MFNKHPHAIIICAENWLKLMFSIPTRVDDKLHVADMLLIFTV